VVGYGVDVRKDGLYTSLYEKSQRYPYDKLFIYNFERKTLYEVTGYQSALRYFEASGGSSGNRCPPGHEGYGVRVF
jgi:hypothetical protein